VLGVDVTAALVELTEADDVGGEPRDEVHPRQREMLPGFPFEQDGAGAFNSDLRPVAKLDEAADRRVDVDEGVAAT
jgi:hypothetical protein